MSIIACSVNECERRPQAKGMCGMHYARFKRHGDPLFTINRPRAPRGNRSTCEVDGCESRVKGKGYCLMHYQRYQKTGDPLRNPSGREVRAYSDGDECEVQGCGSAPKKLGYCGMHYQRAKKYGDPTFTSHREVCEVDGCGGKHYGRGYCSNHRYRFAATGDPLLLPALVDPERICPRCGDGFDISVPAKGRANPGFMRKCCENCTRNTKVIRFVPDIVQRDGLSCGICGIDVDLTLKHPHRMSRSVDHIIPWSLGGEDDMSNYQLAHLSCNARKQDRLEYVAA